MTSTLYNFIKEALESDDYKGQHQPAGKEDGCPMTDVTQNGVYPDDFYSVMGSRYYGDGRNTDNQVWSMIARVHNKKWAQVKIYRAVPHKPTNAERITKLEKEKAEMLKTGNLPMLAVTPLTRSQYYDKIDTELERLLKHDDESPPRPKLKIEPGNWVTIFRPYASEHGRAALNNEYKILSKTVFARDLYTEGNSMYEWGWEP
tara:strand:- start:784 stop:1392 length:609 start_codon:yes stop_codon:yes gene_type:complete